MQNITKKPVTTQGCCSPTINQNLISFKQMKTLSFFIPQRTQNKRRNMELELNQLIEIDDKEIAIFRERELKYYSFSSD